MAASDVEAGSGRMEFKIQGMDCAEEIAILKRELAPLAGGEDRLAFDLLKARVTVRAPDDRPLSPDQVVAAVARTGMKAQLWSEDQVPASRWERNGRTLLTVVSGSALAAGFLTHSLLAGSVTAAIGREGLGGGHVVPWATGFLYLVAAVSGAWYVLPKAWLALRRLRPDMNLLMTIAVVGATVLGEWFEAATVAFLFGLSLALEAWSVARARRAVEALLELAPDLARKRGPRGQEVEVPASEVDLGSVVIVKPGERIPLDGRVVVGESGVDQAPITGESAPVWKEPGAEVFAGTINGDGALEIETTRRAEDTMLAHVIRMVEDAQSRRAPAEQWVERFARYYTPAVMGLALLVAVLPPLLGQPWEDWIYRALVLLVIACPCALVISTPVSIVAGLAAAARQGVLVKGGLYLELPSRLRAVAMDKTGTLTHGRPVVVEVVPLDDHDEPELLATAAALEARSEHPLARAILAHAEARGVGIEPAEGFKILRGRGAEGRVDGREYWLGSHRLLEERGQETPDLHQRLEQMARQARTAIVVGSGDHVCGVIGVADEVRAAAAGAVRDLRAAGIQAVVMLTGDNRATADAVAKATGVDEVHAEILPAEKVDAVDDLLSRYGQVAMVGDGVNDAPALARATVGVAMGVMGSDAAIETADVALMSDDLAKLAWLVHHSRRTMRVIRQNITLSLAIKAVFVALTFVGFASMWAAIAADMGTSLVVIANGLRLLRPQWLRSG